MTADLLPMRAMRGKYRSPSLFTKPHSITRFSSSSMAALEGAQTRMVSLVVWGVGGAVSIRHRLLRAVLRSARACLGNLTLAGQRRSYWELCHISIVVCTYSSAHYFIQLV